MWIGNCRALREYYNIGNRIDKEAADAIHKNNLSTHSENYLLLFKKKWSKTVCYS